MNLKNFFCAAMLAVMFFMPHETFAESATEKLVQIEKDTYGEESTGAILDRISRLEKDFFGENLQKNMNARIESIYDSLYENVGEPGVIAKVNALEWNVNHEVNGGGIEARISDLEKKILGKEQKGSFSERIRELSKATFGDENIPMTQTQLPANTLVKVALVENISSKTLQEGDTIHIKAVENVTVDGKVVFVAGLRGEGVVKSVRKAKGWTGRNGKVDVDFETLRTIDGKNIEIYVGEEAKAEMTEKQMVEGASLVAMNLNDKWSKVLVHGKNIELTAGTELYVQTKNPAAVYVLSAD